MNPYTNPMKTVSIVAYDADGDEQFAVPLPETLITEILRGMIYKTEGASGQEKDEEQALALDVCTTSLETLEAYLMFQKAAEKAAAAIRSELKWRERQDS